MKHQKIKKRVNARVSVDPFFAWDLLDLRLTAPCALGDLWRAFDMPSGKTHTRIDLFLLVIIIGIGACFWNPLVEYFGRDEMVEYATVFVIAYLFGTFFTIA